MDIEQLARALADARLQGHAIPVPEPRVPAQSAYAVQTRVTELLQSPRVGWKVGSTSAAAQARLNTSEPGAGAIVERFCFASGEAVAVSAAHDVFIEVEFAVRMAQTLHPRAQTYGKAEVRTAVAAALPALEIVGTRFDSGLSGAGREQVTADGGANIAFVAGAATPWSSGIDLANSPCELWINGDRRALGTGAEALGDPIEVLTWLANHLSSRGIPLEAGELVSTGTCTGLERIGAGDLVEGRFAELGSVQAHITALTND